MTSNTLIDQACHLCGEKDYQLLVTLEKKPDLETDYGIPDSEYYREICQCRNCNVFFNRHNNLIKDDFYEGHYNASIKMGNILNRYNKIISFPIEKSDNKQRAQRVNDYMISNHFISDKSNILDVGSGTCVFLHEMKKFGYNTYCIDPDPISVQHSIDNVGVDGGFTGVLKDYKTDKKFDLITFNKVLEHIKRPSEILKQAKDYLKEDGYIYVELPDGTEIFEQGIMSERSEFFLEHYTTFNTAAFEKMVELAQLEITTLKRIHDPSGKHTIYAFLKNSNQ